MDRDTDIGGPGDHRFPLTRLSAIEAARSDDPAIRRGAFEAIVAAYWKPVYKYVRLKWGADNELAKDLTQGFFASTLERRVLERYEPGRASFRTFLRTCLDGYVANEKKAAGRQKRGGHATVALDFESAEAEFAKTVPAAETPEEYFYKEWVRALFASAVDALHRECEAAGKQDHFRLFELYDLETGEGGRPSSYAELAERFVLPATQVTNYLAWARRRFRRLVLDQLRHSTATEQEFRDEARALLGSTE